MFASSIYIFILTAVSHHKHFEEIVELVERDTFRRLKLLLDVNFLCLHNCQFQSRHNGLCMVQSCH